MVSTLIDTEGNGTYLLGERDHNSRTMSDHERGSDEEDEGSNHLRHCEYTREEGLASEGFLDERQLCERSVVAWVGQTSAEVRSVRLLTSLNHKRGHRTPRGSRCWQLIGAAPR